MTDALHQSIIAFFKANPGKRALDLDKAVTAKPTTLRTRLCNMVARDELRREGSGVHTRYFVCAVVKPTWETPEVYFQASSIWRVGQRCAAEARGIKWRAEHA